MKFDVGWMWWISSIVNGDSFWIVAVIGKIIMAMVLERLFTMSVSVRCVIFKRIFFCWVPQPKCSVQSPVFKQTKATVSGTFIWSEHLPFPVASSL